MKQEKRKIIRKHPLAIRWFHWINFPVLAIMIWSGLLIYWANRVYKIQIGDTLLFKFFPDSFFKALHVPFRLAEGMNWHFTLMWLFFINGFCYVLYTIISGEWRLLWPDKKSLQEAWQVLLFDFTSQQKFIRPQLKYNAAQKIAYSAIIIMGFGSILTGLAIYKPVQFSFICAICGGYETARLIHFVLTIGYVLFFLVHIIQVIKTGWNNFQAMITGFEIVKSKASNKHEKK